MSFDTIRREVIIVALWVVKRVDYPAPTLESGTVAAFVTALDKDSGAEEIFTLEVPEETGFTPAEMLARFCELNLEPNDMGACL